MGNILTIEEINKQINDKINEVKNKVNDETNSIINNTKNNVLNISNDAKNKITVESNRIIPPVIVPIPEVNCLNSRFEKTLSFR